MAIVAYNYQTIYDNLYGIFDNGYLLTNKKAVDQFSSTLRRIMLDAQDNFLTGGEAAAGTFLQNTRKFILNPTGSDVIIPYNGKDRTFGFLTSTSMHPKEWDFFMDKIREQGLPLVDDPAGAAYFGGSGAIQFFYW